MRIRVDLTVPLRDPLALQRRAGTRWITVTALRRPGTRNLLRFRPRPAGLVRYRLRWNDAGRIRTRAFSMRVTPAPRPAAASPARRPTVGAGAVR
ncbi:MAG TPA: hypothetical protein VNT51_11730 [Miltoncostaeaceae bacterium]|nr:hypothetical protein [Miltoncostaeaceae bacterium]